MVRNLRLVILISWRCTTIGLVLSRPIMLGRWSRHICNPRGPMLTLRTCAVRSTRSLTANHHVSFHDICSGVSPVLDRRFLAFRASALISIHSECRFVLAILTGTHDAGLHLVVLVTTGGGLGSSVSRYVCSVPYSRHTSGRRRDARSMRSSEKSTSAPLWIQCAICKAA
jgi:hypothetical protein